ncbi:hypothetical protein MHI02_03765 [Oceanobacillus sp. FSL K6-0118]|uniref:hypothetical protein n=1 Tax=Oceanobacillus sp. FSL K6-0118 TaxID=2921418 RepID=UPI0030FADE27
MDLSDFSDDFIALVREKVKTIGEVKTVKYLRKEKDMTMIQAKQFVDAVKK